MILPAPGEPKLVINEIDYDQPGTDIAEFLEIKNTGGTSANLDTYELRLINGAGGATYQTINLPDVNLNSGDYYVICSDVATVANCDLDIINAIQNGDPDAIALYDGATLIDTVSYGGDVPGYTETTGAQKDLSGIASMGISRYPDGQDTDNNSLDFAFMCITPGSENTCSPSIIDTEAITEPVDSTGSIDATDSADSNDSEDLINKATPIEEPIKRNNKRVGSASFSDTPAFLKEIEGCGMRIDGYSFLTGESCAFNLFY
jgi:hypothetical protein